ncbi:MAG: hypothetical protein V3S51_07535, partial [Dehalococcoidia bacterium]
HRGKDGMEIRYEWGKVSRQVQKSPENSALTVFLFGIGVLILTVGLSASVLSPGLGLVGGVGSWVAALVTREYLDTSVHDDEIEFDVE